jgi:hypothetical protein
MKPRRNEEHEADQRRDTQTVPDCFFLRALRFFVVKALFPACHSDERHLDNQPATSQAGTRDLFLSYNRRDSIAFLTVATRLF